MPRTRKERQSSDNHFDEPSGAEGPVTFTTDHVTAMMATLQRSQTEAFERLLEKVAATPRPETAAGSEISSSSGNFARCSSRFSGGASESVDAFIDAVESFRECTNVSEANSLRGLSMLLTDNAATWWQGVKLEINSWSEAIEYLQSAYGDHRPPHRIYQELFQCKQGEEKTDIFIAKARALLSKLPPGDLSEKVQVDMVYGQLHRRIKKRLRRDEVKCFAELIRTARLIEESLNEGSNDAVVVSPSTTDGAQRLTSRAPPETPAPLKAPPAPSSSTPQCQSDVLASDSTAQTPFRPLKNNKSEVKPKSNQFCAYCKSFGHNKNECRRLSLKMSTPSKQGNEIVCYGCGERGVVRTNCPKCSADIAAINFVKSRKQQQRSVPLLQPSVQTPDELVSSNFTSKHDCTGSETNHSSSNNLFHSINNNNNLSTSNKFYVNNPDLDSRVDRVQPRSQSRATMRFSKKIRKSELHSRVTMNFRDKNKNLVPSTSTIDYDEIIDLSSLTSVSPGNSCVERPILKIEIFDFKCQALVDTAAKRSIAGSSLYRLLQQRDQSFNETSMLVRLADGSTQTRRILTTNLKVTLKQGKTVTLDFVILPDAIDNDSLLGIDFLTAAGIIIDFAALTWQFSDDSNIYPLELESPRNEVSCCSATLLRDDEAVVLNPAERERLTSLLQCNEDIFQLGGVPTPFAEHHIDTGDHPPISVPPYRLTPAKKALMKTEVDAMLEEGIIEECESAWTSPAILVPKKDNGVRFCVDYRRLNSITKTDTYPLPLIDELLQSTKQHCYMTTIDLRSSYWQVSVFPEDRDKTAFITPFGTYRFTRMPFGLKNAPSTFQRLIDRLRSGAALQDVVLIAYLDDLLVISDSFSSHLDDLQKVFDRLRLFGLRANRDKCFFARNEVKYLGHVISSEGIKPDPSKIDAVLSMKEPKNVKHLKSFMQTCSWFRKFVPNFSNVVQPLSKLTRKNVSWCWTEEQQAAFDCLKQKLTSTPILVQADYTKPFVLRTDASNYALGAVLMQGEGHEERPIEYASRLLTSAERNYSTTEREALAVVWAVEKFRGYLDGHPVYVKTDHQPLRWLLTHKSPSGRLIRWALKLQSYDIHYDYTPGKANVLADALSRPQCNNTENCEVCAVTIDFPRAGSSEIRQEQLQDPEVAKIINDLEDYDANNTPWIERGYVLDQGVLYRLNPETDADEPQLVVPASLREKVVHEFHNTPTAGHMGIERTLDRIKYKYYFTGMRKYVMEYLKNCEDCQRYKICNLKPAGLLQTPVLNQRGEVLAIDLFGPLPEGKNGEKWVLLVEDTATRWVELYALADANAETCASLLINEYFLRYGFPRRVISDNGVQFVSATMQQCMFVLGIKQNLIPLYHPEANPAERKNRDLKTQLAILVKNEHRSWPKFLSEIRFAMNSATCATTGCSPAHMMFAREMRTPFDAQRDLRAILDKENFLPQITPYLRRFVTNWESIREKAEQQQDNRKEIADQRRCHVPSFEVGDLVLVTTHLLSNASKGRTRKFMPRRDGPYRVAKVVSPTTFEVADLVSNQLVGKFHQSDLTTYTSNNVVSDPVQPRRRRGRPRVKPRSLDANPPTGRLSVLEGECITRSPNFVINHGNTSPNVPTLPPVRACAERPFSNTRAVQHDAESVAATDQLPIRRSNRTRAKPTKLDI